MCPRASLSKPTDLPSLCVSINDKKFNAMRLHSLTLIAAAAAAQSAPSQEQARKEARPTRLLNEALEVTKASQERLLIEALATATANASASSSQPGSAWDTFDSQNEDAPRLLEDEESTTEVPTTTPTVLQMTPAELYEEWWSDLSPEMQSAFNFLGWDKGELFLL